MAEKNYMKSRGAGQKREPKEFDERVIEVSRVSRVVKGGRRIRFRALVCIGDHKGRVGMGVAKATEVTEAVRKATNYAKKHIITVPIINGSIPHEMVVKYGSAKVMIKPATSGTTIVAGGSVRIVAELAGITDLLSKIMGSSNKINNVTATIKALSSFNPEIVAKIQDFAKKAEGKVSTKAVLDLRPETEDLETEKVIDETIKTDVIASETKQSVPAEINKVKKVVEKAVKKTIKKSKKE